VPQPNETTVTVAAASKDWSPIGGARSVTAQHALKLGHHPIGNETTWWDQGETKGMRRGTKEEKRPNALTAAGITVPVFVHPSLYIERSGYFCQEYPFFGLALLCFSVEPLVHVEYGSSIRTQHEISEGEKVGLRTFSDTLWSTSGSLLFLSTTSGDGDCCHLPCGRRTAECFAVAAGVRRPR
jgi:hypothetical protein